MKNRKFIKFGLLLLYCVSVLLINPTLSFSNQDFVGGKGNNLLKISEASDSLKSPIQVASQIKIVKEEGRSDQFNHSDLTLFYSRPGDFSLAVVSKSLIDPDHPVQLKFRESDIAYPFHSFW